ncbi:MAG: glutamate racemase [Acutalibacteraceae bacterium]
MISKNSPIAVFDSGIGGVSVLRELYKIMPNENYLYFGDSKNAPYGTKSTEEICKLIAENVEMLIAKGSKAVVLACNTATSAAAEVLRKKHSEIPIIGLEPALKPAALSSAYPTVVVMATPLTLREKKFARLMMRFEKEAKIIKLPAPGIVELVEQGKMGTTAMTDYLESLFSGLDKSKIDCVVLGCTHFPFAKDDIIKVVGSHVQIFDGANGAARQTERLLEESGMLCEKTQKGQVVFENSDERHIELSKKLFSL